MTRQHSAQAKTIESAQSNTQAPTARTPAAHPMLHLQRQVGNQAATAIVQAKLTVGEPNDRYEQEADRVAAQVVRQIHTPTPPTAQRSSQANATPQIQPLVQCKGSTGGMEVSADVEAGIQQARGSGQPLPEGLRSSMEQAFGADFSGVRIHTNGESDRLNQAIHAKAFTVGENVFFRQGEYNPDHRDGQILIAHELTHVVQQNREATKLPIQTVQPGHVQRVVSDDEKARIVDPARISKALILNLYRRHDLTAGAFLGVYRARRSDRPGIQNCSFAVEIKIKGVEPLEYHAHISVDYREKKKKIKNFRDLEFSINTIHKSHLKKQSGQRDVGNLIDLTGLPLINDEILEKHKEDIWKSWYENLFVGGTERDRSEFDDRHNIIDPSLNLIQWSKSLIKGRIEDLFITLGGIPNHVQQVNQELTRLKPFFTDESSSNQAQALKQAALLEIEVIKNALFTSMSNAKFEEIDLQTFTFPTKKPTYFLLSKTRNKVSKDEYGGD